MTETVLYARRPARIFVAVLMVLGDLALLAIPLLVGAAGAAVVVVLVVMTVLCAAALTWFLLRLINARVVVGETELTVHYLLPRPAVIARDQIATIEPGRFGASIYSGAGSWLPLVRSKSGGAFPLLPLSRGSENGAAEEIARVQEALGPR